MILALTELIEQTKSDSEVEQQAIMRRAILWCVEAYFGHLGGQSHRPAEAESTQPAESTGQRP